MPIVNVSLIEGVFSQDQKEHIVSEITDLMVSLEGEFMRDKTFVLIDEVRSGNWGIGGNAMTTEAIQKRVAEARSRAPASVGG